MSSTRLQRRYLVEAVQIEAGMGLDDLEYQKWIPDEMDESDVGVFPVRELSDDDLRVGGLRRTELAEQIWKLRKMPGFKGVFRESVRKMVKSMSKNPRRWGFDTKKRSSHGGRQGSKPRSSCRRYPLTIHRRAVKAKSHSHCAYCGWGGTGIFVCGECREAGVDGPVIPGTVARRATTYVQWRRMPNPNDRRKKNETESSC